MHEGSLHRLQALTGHFYFGQLGHVSLCENELVKRSRSPFARTAVVAVLTWAAAATHAQSDEPKTAATSEPPHRSALDAPLFYQLLIGEMQLRSGQPGVAYGVILDEASLKAYAQRIAEDNLNAWRAYMFEEGDLMADHREAYKAGGCKSFSRLTSTTADAIVATDLGGTKRLGRMEPAVRAAKGAREVLAWAYERPTGGRGFGYTGAHFHKNWGNDDFRRLMLNALVWTAGLDVPSAGVASTVSNDDMAAHLDVKK